MNFLNALHSELSEIKHIDIWKLIFLNEIMTYSSQNSHKPVYAMCSAVCSRIFHTWSPTERKKCDLIILLQRKWRNTGFIVDSNIAWAMDISYLSYYFWMKSDLRNLAKNQSV